MTRIKIIRMVLLLSLVVFVGLLVTNYRTGESISDTSADEDLSQLTAGEKLIQKEFSQKRYDKETLEHEISAREVINYQDGVNVLEEFHFTRGADGMDVQSDFGRHDQESGDAFLWENVLIRDGQGMTISTEAAWYDEESATLAGNRPVEFTDLRFSGSSLGVVYRSDSGELQLPAEVSLTINGARDSAADPVHIQAGFLKLNERAGIAYLARGVRLEQGRLSLACQTLRIAFEGDTRRLRHVSAFGAVELEMSPGDGAGGAGGGLAALGDDRARKTLTARQLEIFFPRHSAETARVQYIVARGEDDEPAALLLHDAGTEGHRRLEGRRLVFRFSPHGAANRLESFHGHGDCLVTLAGFTAGDGGEGDARLAAETITARFHGEQQDLQAAEAEGRVRFIRGEEQIRGGRADWDAVAGLLTITGGEDGRLPRLLNRDLELEAVRIDYGVDGQWLTADQEVWVKVKSGDDADRRGLDVGLFSRGREGEPIYIQADRLESDLASGVTSFRGTVRVLEGENVLSAKNLWLFHQDRRMEALERVLLTIHPLVGEDSPTPDLTEATTGLTGLPAVTRLAGNLAEEEEEGAEDDSGAEEPMDPDAPVQIACQRLIYDDQARYIVLDDRVSVRKDKTRLVADHMEVQLAEADNRVLHIIASAVGVEPPTAGEGLRPGTLLTGFDRQQQRLGPPSTGTTDNPAGTGDQDAEQTAEGGRGTAAAVRPVVPQVTLSQPGGRMATGERVLFYPGEQMAVLVGLDSVATIVDPRSGSAQGTSLTYHLADGKILNRANENEVTLVLLHSGLSAPRGAGQGSSASTRGNRGRSARGPAGRSASR